MGKRWLLWKHAWTPHRANRTWKESRDEAEKEAVGPTFLSLVFMVTELRLRRWELARGQAAASSRPVCS